MKLMNLEIESGLSWPFEEVFPDFDSFSKYFLSHAAFVVRVRGYEVRLTVNGLHSNYHYFLGRRHQRSFRGVFLTVLSDVSTSSQTSLADVVMFVMEAS